MERRDFKKLENIVKYSCRGFHQPTPGWGGEESRAYPIEEAEVTTLQAPQLAGPYTKTLEGY